MKKQNNPINLCIENKGTVAKDATIVMLYLYLITGHFKVKKTSVTHEDISKRIDICLRRVRNAKKLLVSKGYILEDRRRNSSGQFIGHLITTILK